MLFIPLGGINDCCNRIEETISYCVSKNRTLLLDFTNSEYVINFSDHFTVKTPRCKIIWDSNEIAKILLNLKEQGNLSVHPSNLRYNVIDLFNENRKNIPGFNFVPNAAYSWAGIPLELPKDTASETVILHSRCGGGDGYRFFKTLGLQDATRNTVTQKMRSLGNDYLCIQVRNTDLKCDYMGLYTKNKGFIHGFKQIYLCTDSKTVYNYFKSLGLNVACFTTFPDSCKDGVGLHHTYVGLTPYQKMLDVIVDIFIATNSKKILSNSKGGFINLLRNCHQNKNHVLKMLE